MRNLKNYGVVEISSSSSKLVQGGSWIGEVLGTAVGAAVRYGAPIIGVQNAILDYSIYQATK